MLISIKPPTAWIGHSPCMLNRQNGALDQTAAKDSASALAAKVDFLSRPDSYIPRSQAVVARDRRATRMLGDRGPAQPSPTLGDALNAGYVHLEVRCLGCDTHQTVALDIVRRPKSTPIHELEREHGLRDEPLEGLIPARPTLQ